MTRYAAPHVPAGTIPTGAGINAWLDAIAASATGITADQIDPATPFPRDLFHEDCGVLVVGVYGIDAAGQPVANTWTFTIPAFCTFRGAPGVDNATGLTTTIPATSRGAALAVGDAFAEGDEITVSVPAGVTGSLRFRMYQVARG